MPQSWLEGIKKRSVERDYNYYDSPKTVWIKINSKTRHYNTNRLYYNLRDVAFMSLLYLTCARISELCRADLSIGYKKSITKDHFVPDNEFIRLRDLIVLKRKNIESLEDYPLRDEILLPKSGGLSIFTNTVINYLECLSFGEELFKFRRQYGWKICRGITGEMPHYFRAMGIKLYTRVLNKNPANLQKFTSHARIENLLPYLMEGTLEDSILRYEF